LEKKTTSEWSVLFEASGIPYSPINDIRRICEDPITRHRKMLVEIEQPGAGRVQIAGSPIRLSETPGEVYAPAPRLGEHSEAVLREILDCPEGEVAALRRAGVIFQDCAE
jgi:CoA:oxalate CoA-transferase